MEAFSSNDFKDIEAHGLTKEQAIHQAERIKRGVAFPEVLRTAAIEDGILRIPLSGEQAFIDTWLTYLKKGKTAVHFIPASGLAGRFFRDLEAFLRADYTKPTTDFEKNFFKHLNSFAFFGELNRFCVEHLHTKVEDMLEQERYKELVEVLLTDKGLNYSILPCSLFKFHTDKSRGFASIQKYLPNSVLRFYSAFEDVRTPVQECLIEGAMTSGVRGREVQICLTIQCEHLDLLQEYVRQFKIPIEKKLGIRFQVTLLCQPPSTDAILFTPKGELCRDEGGHPVFCPAGHGVLLEYLNAQKAGVVFIKNIDNAASDDLKKLTVRYRKIMAGLLLQLQRKIFLYLRLLDKGECTEDQLIDIIHFVENTLNSKKEGLLALPRDEQVAFLRQKLNRPLRVCGMVRNEDEPGGMPCWVRHADGTAALQIVEYYQIDQHKEEARKRFLASTYFNPVDMVCGLVDYKGKHFDLMKYANPAAEMIHTHNWNNAEVLSLERPGLWNGGMADWNTIFMELPIKTFNPVKSVNDLLRQEHLNL